MTVDGPLGDRDRGSTIEVKRFAIEQQEGHEHVAAVKPIRRAFKITDQLTDHGWTGRELLEKTANY